MSNYVGIPGSTSSSNSFTFAGQTYFTNLDKKKIFGFSLGSTSTTNASPLVEILSPTTAYRVPVGKKLVILGVTGDQVNPGINLIGYANNAAVVSGDPADLVSPVPTPTNAGNGAFWIEYNDSSGQLQVPLYLEVPAGKYPFALGWGSGSTTTGYVIAFELDA